MPEQVALATATPQGLQLAAIRVAQPYGAFNPWNVAVWLGEHRADWLAALMVSGDGDVPRLAAMLAQFGHWCPDTLVMVVPSVKVPGVVHGLRYELAASTVAVIENERAVEYMGPAWEAGKLVSIVRCTWHV